MDILIANDSPGQLPPSWYAATALAPRPYEAAKGKVRTDVCVVGGGYTGLSSALHLARRGYKVTLVEAQRIGFGASGRNGGQVSTGQRLDQEDLESLVGLSDARKLWDLGCEAVALVRGLIAQGNMDCGWTPGVIHANHRARFSADTKRHVEHMNRVYNHSQIRYLDRAAIAHEIGSPNYHSGSLDLDSGHLHPLRYCFGLAKLAQDAGVTLHENSRMTSIENAGRPIVKTKRANIEADFVVLGMNGYHNNIMQPMASHVMPINNFIAVTEPLGEARARELIRNAHAVADSRFVINYFRLSEDHRMIFGGGESYGYRFPTDIAAKVRRPMNEVFPQLANTRIDFAWGGTLGITMSRLPHFARLQGNVISASGFSGQGVALATLAGKLVAEAVAGQSEQFDLMAKLPTPRFPGGTLLRSPLLAAAMLWYAMRDRL